MDYHHLPDDWEASLEYHLVHGRSNRLCKKAYICSPCRGEDLAAMTENMRAARFYMYYATKEMGYLARAPHAYLPLLLNDNDPGERALALRFGQIFIGSHDELFVCGSGITAGMRAEIEVAARLNQPIRTFDADVFVEARKIVTRAGSDKCLVTIDQRHPILALGTKNLFTKGVA